MRRQNTIISAIALVMGLGLPAMMATAVSAQSIPAPTVTGEADWAFGGYSVHPNAGSGWVVDALGSWTVPKVNCPNVADDAPRTAVWVGMWGTLASMGAGQGWLPQIGTGSFCASGSATYAFIWQLDSQIRGDGTAPMLEDANKIKPGDSIQASVVFNGPYGTTAAVRNFSITVTDTTRHIAYQNLDVKTNAAVPLLNIVRQGGVEVEDAIPSTCLVTLPLFGTCLLSNTGGLADYPTPIQLKMTVTPGNDQIGATGWAYLRWQNRYAGVLLQSTPASPDVTSNQDFQTTATFTETWLRQT